jgi:hypothetical protein
VSYATTNIIPGGIRPEDFAVVPADQDLYCTDPNQNRVVRVSRSFFADHVGDLVVVQGFEVHTAALFILHWNAVGFDVTVLNYDGWLEQATFAP